MDTSAPGAPITAAAERTKWTVVASCVVAGGLSVRPDGLGTALAAAGAGLVGWLALRVWEWSRLPSFTRTWLEGEDRVSPIWRTLGWLALGVALGLVLLAFIRLVIQPVLPAIGTRIAAAGTLPLWRRLIIIYVAAVLEELIFRLFLLSAIVGLVIRATRQTTLVPSGGIVWMGNLLAALSFAVVHLPSWTAVAPGHLGLTLSVLALNATAGLVIGYVFVTRGVAAAMWTHAGGDCAIQLLGPLSG